MSKFAKFVAVLAMLFTAPWTWGFPPQCYGQTVSTWQSSLQGDWFDASRWDNGIPSIAGDVARLPGLPRGPISFDGSASLGQLIFFGPGVTVVAGSEALTFDNLGFQPALIQLAPLTAGTPINALLNKPLAIAASEQLKIDVAPQSTLTLGGAITSVDGSVQKTGAGTLVLSAASPSWAGQLLVDAGRVNVGNALALGTTAGKTVISGPGLVSLPMAVLEPFELTSGGTVETKTSSAITMSAPIYLSGNGVLRHEATTAGAVWNSSISGSGGLTLQNTSQTPMVIAGNNTYLGHTYISGTSFRVTNAASFGTTDEGTTIQSGTVFLDVLTDESFTVQIGGTLNLAAAAAGYAHTVNLDGGTLRLPTTASVSMPVAVGSAGGTVQFSASSTTWMAGSNGVGDLSLLGNVTLSSPLNHQGSLSVSQARFNVANSYQGETVVTGNSEINHIDALGTSSLVRLQNSAQLILNVLPSHDPDFVVERGTLRVENFSRPIAGTITLSDATLVGQAIYNGPISVVRPTGSSHLRGGMFNGVISGSGNVDLAWFNSLPSDNNDVTLNGENTYTGTTRIYGVVTANTEYALGTADRGTVVARDGRLTINVDSEERILVMPGGRVDLNAQLSRLPRLVRANTSSSIFDGQQTVAVNVPSAYHQHYDVHQGKFEINANVAVNSLTVRNGGRVITNGAAVLTSAAEDLELQKGGVSGRIAGISTVRKTTNDMGFLGDMHDYAGEYVVERGILQLNPDTSLNAAGGPIRVAGTRDASLEARRSVAIPNDVFLNNATGIDNTGGFKIHRAGSNDTPRVRLDGQLDLGSIGSVIGGQDGSTFGRAILDVHGPITGGGLTTRGRWLMLAIHGNQNTYTGPTEIREGQIELTGNGTLVNTSAIVLYDDVGSEKGKLHLNNVETNRSDRVADAIPIHMKGGAVIWSAPTNAATSESLGPTSFIEGDSLIESPSSDPYYSAHRNDIALASIDRQRGATATFGVGPTAEIQIGDPPPLIGGILPWLIAVDHRSSSNRVTSFATISDRGVAPIADLVNNFHAAGVGDNVFVPTSLTANGSKTINSISFDRFAQLDLNGHRLTVDSGGVMSGIIRNGELTAGDPSEHELIIYNAKIDANIVDNGQHPLHVTVTGGSFTGVNTYSGSTYVNGGELYLANEASLPAGTDLQIIGGEVQIGYNATEPKHLGRVRIAGNGALTQQFTGVRGQGIFSFDEVIIEDGNLVPGRLVGEGQIRKRSPGVGGISVASEGSTYSGQVVVEEGLLSVNGLNQATFLVQDGTLVLRTGPNDVVLAGGALEFLSLTGTIHVSAPSRIIRAEGSSNGFTGVLSGDGDLVFDNRPLFGDVSVLQNASVADAVTFMRNRGEDYTGHVHIHTATVSVRYEDSLGTGDITIRAGGQLQLSPLQGNFDGARLDLPNNIYLAGGYVRGFDSVFRPQRLLGDVFVSGNSFIGTLDVLGAVHLADGSRLTTTEYDTTRFLGDIVVGGTAEIEIGRTIVRSSALEANRGLVEVSGRVVSNATNAVLKLESTGLDDLVFSPSIHVQHGKSLLVLHNGTPKNLVLSNGAKLTGGGVFHNPIQVEDGAVLSPGQSTGKLVLADNLTVGPGAIYDWEINSPQGIAGAADGWDLIEVGGDLVFTATAESPFIVRVFGLDTLPLDSFSSPNLREPQSWLVATANSIHGFDTQAVVFDIQHSANKLRSLLPQHLTLNVDDGGLYLVYQIPEPSTSAIVLIFIGIVVLLPRCQASQSSLSKSPAANRIS